MSRPLSDPPFDPFIFVAATRYAILRTLTGASETVCSQVEAHAAAIRADAGAAAAICQEIDAFLASDLAPVMGQSENDLAAIKMRWADAGEALR